ncbi:hypothetical protein ACEQ8H_006787 [Pleosporales sp. CAS-2024a]
MTVSLIYAFETIRIYTHRGSTVSTSYVNSLGECLEDCSKTLDCVDVSYEQGTPGPCYKKNAIGDIRVNSNIWGGRQLSGCVATGPKLKLHRKRVVKKEPDMAMGRIFKRGIPYGPDYTYYGQPPKTVTSTSTVTNTAPTVTITPANSGTTTTTVTRTPTVEAVIATTTTVTSTVASYQTVCPLGPRF